MHFRDAVLVVEGDGGFVFVGLLVAVDADVLAKDLPRPLLGNDERCGGEGDEGGVGQGVSHVHGQDVVLAAVRLVGHDDDVGAVRKPGVALTASGVELVDDGEDVAVILS